MSSLPRRVLLKCFVQLSFTILATAALGPARAAIAAAPPPKIALVVGVANYQQLPKLQTPANDAKAVAQSLRAAGFAQVTLELDTTRTSLRAALKKFSQDASRASLAIVYYAGSAAQLRGENLILPVDTPADDTEAIRQAAVPLDVLEQSVEGAQELGVLVLDACNSDNPSPGTNHRGVRADSDSRVLRGLVHAATSSGLVIFSASPGEDALDRIEGSNLSPFASAFVGALEDPEVTFATLLARVGHDVETSTGGKQRPWVQGSARGLAVALRKAPVSR